jgi:hypothetical protein
MERKQEPSSPDNLAKDVAGLIDAFIGVGAAVAKATAEATARGAECPPPEAGAASFSVLVHYGLATAGNLISLVSSAAGVARSSVGKATPTKSESKAQAGAIPRVRPGAKLRVPLSVENTSDRPMTGLSPRLRRVLVAGIKSSSALPADAVQFTPQNFNVMPKDFEKLTLSVTVPETAATGRYDLILALGPTEPDLPLSFEVIPEEAG